MGGVSKDSEGTAANNSARASINSRDTSINGAWKYP